MARRYFEDITEGERVYCQKVTITRQDIIEFGKRFGPKLFHTDAWAVGGSDQCNCLKCSSIRTKPALFEGLERCFCLTNGPSKK
jgi:acyl dehydratase